MFEQLGLDGWTPRAASVVLGLVIGALFGVLAQRSRFCLRRGLVGDASERSAALGTWLIALAVAVAGTAVLTSYGLLSFSDHRFHAASLPVGALIVGGLMFGADMEEADDRPPAIILIDNDFAVYRNRRRVLISGDAPQRKILANRGAVVGRLRVDRAPGRSSRQPRDRRGR